MIVARYEKNQDNGIESLDLKVIQGTPAESTPTVPEYTEGDIQAGDYVADMPMYQVLIDGLNITEVKKVFEVAPGIDALKKEIAELNSNKIGNKDNLISMLVANAKTVEDCLTQTTESGVYRWYSAKNQPSTGGYMIVFKYHSGASMRLALTNSGAYYSTYQAGVTYGSWEKL